MSNLSRTNAARWILSFQALVFFIAGGFEIMAFPKEMCPYMGKMRAVVEDRIECPEYLGDHPIFEMYTFSLGKHVLMIGLMFAYFAVFGRSKAAIQAGLIYAPLTLAIDWIPPLTWLTSSGASTTLFPPIFWSAVLAFVLSAAGLSINARHSEWTSTTSS